MKLDAAVATFAAEARELLDDMEDRLLAAEAGDRQDGDAVHALFRAAHTIKGSGGLFGYDRLVEFTHHVETVLDLVREGRVPLTGELTGLLLRCKDHISVLVAEAVDGTPCTPAELADQQGLVRLLAAAGGQAIAQLPGQAGTGSTATAHDAASAADHDGAPDVAGTHACRTWRVHVAFGLDVLRSGLDPLPFLRYLAALGTVASVHTDASRLPALADFDPESCYLGCQLEITGDLDEERIASAFEFVRDDCTLDIQPLSSAGQAPMASPLVDGAEANATDHAAAGTDGHGAGSGRAAPAEARSAESRFLRVEADKLDHLINLIGELVIAGASCNLLAARLRSSDMIEATSSVSALVESIRESALNLRMVQIGATFSRFHRVVRDLSRELGKDIELRISGAETELDKSVVEKIADPLMHLVRNALDHGIESVERRRAAGKPDTGVLQLHAYHESGSIVIEVADDGGGLDSERIRAKAVERGLIPEGLTLAERDVHALIFEPGFSTASAVTNLSGRGVGMDVVRRNIEGLRGSVEVESQLGRGTTMRIRLPLTLAIIDGFLVGVAGASYVLPLDMVMECVELQAAHLEASGGRNYVNLRGEVLPFVRLRHLFEKTGAPPRRENIVVVRHAGKSAGLVVDELLGDFQTVIKPLGRLFGTVRGISGSTILGSGDVALILDVPSLIGLAAERERSESLRPASGAQSAP